MAARNMAHLLPLLGPNCVGRRPAKPELPPGLQRLTAAPSAPMRPRLVARHRAVVEHGLRPAILRPAGDVVADRDRPLLAVGDRADAACAHARLSKVPSHRRGPAGAKREVVFARAALVGMAFDGDGVLRILIEPDAPGCAGCPAPRRSGTSCPPRNGRRRRH